jgi:ADP-ribose pyrophosphatase
MDENLNNKLPRHAKCVFKGILFDVYQWEQELFDGTTTTFEKVVRLGSTQIIAITKDKKILLYHEEQPGMEPFISMPGGQLDKEDTTPEEGAKRELLEETGMKAKTWELFHTSELSSKIIWPTYYYIAKDCEKIQESQCEAGEKIEIIELSFEEFVEYTQKETFRNKYFQYYIFRLIHTNKLKEFKTKLFN